MARPIRYLFRKLRMLWLALAAFALGAIGAAVSPTIYDVASDVAAVFSGPDTNRSRAALLLNDVSVSRDTAVLKASDLEAANRRVTVDLATAEETIADRDGEISELGLSIIDLEQLRHQAGEQRDLAIAHAQAMDATLSEICALAADVQDIAALCQTAASE